MSFTVCFPAKLTKPFECLQSVKKLDFDVAALLSFDFGNVEKVHLLNLLGNNIVGKKKFD